MEEHTVSKTSDTRIVAKLLFRLLPVQILLAAVGAVNGIVSSYFATNYVGVDAMSAVGLYSPFNMLLTALSTMMAGGAAILCGKYLGQNKQDRLNNVFSVDLAVSALIAILFTALFVVLSLFDLTGFITGDEAAVRSGVVIEKLRRVHKIRASPSASRHRQAGHVGVCRAVDHNGLRHSRNLLSRY